MNKEDAIEQAKKLLEFKSRGNDAEHLNAEEKLQRLLTKYELTIDDVDPKNEKERMFKLKNQEEVRFLSFIINHVVGSERKSINYNYAVRKNKEFKHVKKELENCYAVFVNDFEYMEISELLEQHLKAYEKEKKDLLKKLMPAYMYRNELFSKERESNDDSMPTPEEIEERHKTVMAAQLFNKNKIIKKLEN